MDRYDYHFISFKFLSAIIMAVFFAFILLYVFSPVKDDYSVYSFELQEVEEFSEADHLNEEDENAVFLDLSPKKEFENELQSSSFAVMEGSRKAVLTVVTANHLEEINGLAKEGDLLLNDYRLELKNEEEKLLQRKQKELEADLSSKLQNLRRKVKEKYSDFSQKEIRDNYLKIINLRIAVEVLAQDELEKEKYQKTLTELKEEQDKLLAGKNNIMNEEISAETSKIVLEFNQQYADYREMIRKRHQNLLANKKDEINMELNRQRENIKLNLNSEREKKVSLMDQLIEKSRKYY